MTLSKRMFPLPVSFGMVLMAALVLGFLAILENYVLYLYTDTEFDWFRVSGNEVISLLLWALLSPVIYHIIHLEISRKILKIPLNLVVCILISFVHNFITMFLYFMKFYLEDSSSISQRFTEPSAMIAGSLNSMVEYWILFGMLMGVDFYKRYRNKQFELAVLENELTQAQLTALKMQLHPHFLFNALHTISSLMDESVEEAQKILAGLGQLLRRMLDQDQHQTISLNEEIDTIRSYLKIEQTRFRDRLQVHYDIDDQTKLAQVPNFILQPLVENALKHGLSKQVEPGWIRICSRRQAQRLFLTVQDSGKGCHHAESIGESGGIGTQNVRNRLAHLYGGDFSLKFQSPNQKGFSVLMDLPLKTVVEGQT